MLGIKNLIKLQKLTLLAFIFIVSDIFAAQEKKKLPNQNLKLLFIMLLLL